MSGGFFRGTSADQDTRFSNKQAKLLKSQKFAPELDQLIDMTKVKMDVIRPWIATRVTELLGFEDEVLINFVYGLLDGKAVDGKKVQIQLTGFMEKNTGKFMRELWGLLLSAVMNASGVPQQFLDAKEEEMKKKKVETDRIAMEIQKRQEKEGREPERGKTTRMDVEANISRSTNALPDSVHSEEDREADIRHGRRSNNRYSKSPHSSKTPHSNDHSPPPRREGLKSRSVSVSSQSQRHSTSPERRYRSPRRRSVSPLSRRGGSPPRFSISPRRRYSNRSAHSPPRKSSPPRHSISPRRRYSPRNARSPSRRSRRRSGSHPRNRSPSPYRRRSPHARRRSPFLRRRSPSPLRRRSPSPPRRRSPIRRRSPSPSRRRSPIRRKSLSPARRRSPSPPRRRSPPPRSLKHRQSPLHPSRNHVADLQISPRRRKRSRSPYRSQSPSYRVRRSLSRERDRTRERRSPPHHALDKGLAEHPDSGRKVSDLVSRRPPISLRSPQRDSRDQNDIRDKVSVGPPEESPSRSVSPTHVQKINSRKSRSLSGSPVKQTRAQKPRFDSPGSGRENEENSRVRETAQHRTRSLQNDHKGLPADKGLKNSHARDFSPDVYSSDRSEENRSPSFKVHAIESELQKNHGERRDIELHQKLLRRVSPSSGVQYGSRKVKEERFSSDDVRDKQPTKQQARAVSSLDGREHNEPAVKHSDVDGRRVSDERRSYSKSNEHIESHRGIDSISRSKTKVDRSNLLDAIGSDSEETETYTKKQKHKKSDRHKKHVDDDSESESEVDDSKTARRRRKEDKKLRKEEKRRRREEKRNRKLERRASKLKAKSMDTVAPPSDMENNLNSSDESEGDMVKKKVSHLSDTEEPESEQKKLEIELRKKALESLRAKKAISD